MNVKLTRITKTDKSGNLRGEGIEGYTNERPTVGHRFRVWLDREDGSTRFVTTSTVEEILDGNTKSPMFRTFTGSIYRADLS